MTITCTQCGIGPFDGRALFRNKGALFYSGKSIKGEGPLFCAACAPVKIKAAIIASLRCDHETKELAS